MSSIKYKLDETTNRYEARLIAKGYTQTYGINYQDTFAPMTKMNTVRVILFLTVNLDWPLRQFNVKNVLLHGDLLKKVHMYPLARFTPKEGKVCKLKKVLYVIVIDSNSTKLEKLQNYLAKEFEMKDLDALKYLLGIEVS